MLSTKIICTIGPESDSTKILSELADAGMNVARLNFSHGDHKTHFKVIEKIKKINNNRKFPIAILLDTKGPEIRTGNQEIKLTKGKNIIVNSPPHHEKDNSIFVNYSYLHEDLEVGDSISLDGGLFCLTVFFIGWYFIRRSRFLSIIFFMVSFGANQFLMLFAIPVLVNFQHMFQRAVWSVKESAKLAVFLGIPFIYFSFERIIISRNI